MRSVRLRTLILLYLACPVPAFAQSSCPSYSFIRIADTSTVVPGSNGGTFIAASLSEPAVTPSHVAFRGEGGGAEGVFAGDGSSLANLASVGDPVAGGGTVGELFDDFTFSNGVADVFVTPTGGDRGIYSTIIGGPVIKVVEFRDPSPSGGSFSTIFSGSRDLENLAFRANVSFAAANSGVFARIAGVNETVADTETPIPGLPVFNFAGGSFSDPDISGENVVFTAGRGGHHGVYARINGSLVKVADVNDVQPGSIKTFSTFSNPVINGGQVAFRAVGDSVAVYAWNNGTLAFVANSGDPAPGGSTFAGFGPFVATDEGEVAFSGAGSGFIGLFVSGHYGLCRVVDINDTLDGKDITQVFMGRDSYSFGRLGFRAVFSDGSRGIYLAIARHDTPPARPRPTSSGTSLQGLLLLLFGQED